MSVIKAKYYADSAYFPDDASIQWDIPSGNASIVSGQGTSLVEVQTDSDESETFELVFTITTADGQSNTYSKTFTHERVNFDAATPDPFGKDRGGVLYRFQGSLECTKTGWWDSGSTATGDLTPTNGEAYYECDGGEKMVVCSSADSQAYYCDPVGGDDSDDGCGSYSFVSSFIFSTSHIDETDGSEKLIGAIVYHDNYNEDDIRNIQAFPHLILKDRKLYFSGYIWGTDDYAFWCDADPSNIIEKTGSTSSGDFLNYNWEAWDTPLENDTVYHIAIHFDCRGLLSCIVNGEVKNQIHFIKRKDDTTFETINTSVNVSSIIGGYDLDDNPVYTSMKLRNMRWIIDAPKNDSPIYPSITLEEAKLLSLEVQGCSL